MALDAEKTDSGHGAVGAGDPKCVGSAVWGMAATGALGRGEPSLAHPIPQDREKQRGEVSKPSGAICDRWQQVKDSHREERETVELRGGDGATLSGSAREEPRGQRPCFQLCGPGAADQHQADRVQVASDQLEQEGGGNVQERHVS